MDMTAVRLGENQILEHMAHTIAEHLRPHRIVLFGSRARGTAAPDAATSTTRSESQ